MLKFKNTKILLVLLIALATITVSANQRVYAQEIPPGCPGTKLQGPPAPGVKCPEPNAEAKFVDIDCEKSLDKSECGITRYLVDFIKVLTGIVGVVVVLVITIGGVQYSMARDNPQAVAAAKQRIINALLALLLYMFLFAFLQWVVPGGVIK